MAVAPDRAAPRVLVVCTGNICRSPAAAVALTRALAQTHPAVQVLSAGTRAVVGSPIHPLTLAALLERGLNGGCHVAQQLHPALVESADLVLTAERSHRVAVVEADPSAVPRTFTLAEFARLAPLTGRAFGEPGEWRDLVAAAQALRGTARPADPSSDDLSDPVNGGPGDHRSMVDRIVNLVDLTCAVAS